MTGREQDAETRSPPEEQQFRFFSKPSLKSAFSQILGASAMCLEMLGIGLIYGMPTIVVAELLRLNAAQQAMSERVRFSHEIMSEYSKLNSTQIVFGERLNVSVTEHEVSLDEYQTSWFNSIIYICQPFGSIASGFVQDIFGRKRCLMLVSIPQAIAWYVLYSAKEVTHFYIVAAIMGITLGFIDAPVITYIGEVSEPRLRGILISLCGVLLNIGILFEYFIGTVFHWRTMSLLSALVPILIFIAVSQVPESPVWLTYKGRFREAEHSLCWLRGWTSPKNVEKEFKELCEYIGSKRRESKANSRNKRYQQVSTEESGPVNTIASRLSEESDNFQNFLRPAIQRPFRLILMYFFCAHCASLIGVKPFMVHISDSLEFPIDSYWLIFTIAGLQALGNMGCTSIIWFLGRRNTSFLSMIICILCLLLISTYIILDLQEPWAPLILFSVLFFTAQLGISSIPWMLIGELFPVQGRGIAAGVSTACSYLFVFIVTKSYVNLSHWFNFFGALLIYSFVGILGLTYIYFCLPETEGRSLSEIEQFFSNHRHSSVV